ncbi:type I restriction endonuclease [Methanospirillum hungatei]|nr:type I restriction endonuclease [Methanospirillum hungatei]
MADYALILNGKIVGVIEAKRESVGPQEVLTQARRYAIGIPDSVALFSFDEYRVPFLYSSNGTINWFIDVRHEQNRSHEIVRIVNNLFTHTDRVIGQATSARKQVEIQSQTIFHQAFTGKLIQQNEPLRGN